MNTTSTPAPKRRGRPRKFATDAQIEKRELARVRKIDIENSRKPAITWLLITTKQAAEALQVSEGTIHNLIKAGQLESLLIGGCRRISFDDVKALARNGATLPTVTAQNEQNNE